MKAWEQLHPKRQQQYRELWDALREDWNPLEIAERPAFVPIARNYLRAQATAEEVCEAVDGMILFPTTEMRSDPPPASGPAQLHRTLCHTADG